MDRPQGRPGPLKTDGAKNSFSASATAMAAEEGGPISRSDVVARAKTWVDAKVPYSQSSYRSGYRTDCSGRVSMAWNLGTNAWTGNLDTYANRITKSELRKGDMLLFHNAGNPVNGSHVVLFEGWTDSSKTSYIGIEQTPPHAVRRVIPYTYFSNSSSYIPYRYKNIVEDTAAPSTYSGDLPVSGRWSSGSATTVGVFRDGTWALRDANGATASVGFGRAGDVPMTGDFDGVGHDQLGIFRPSTSTFAVRHDDGSTTSLTFGQAGDIPVPGMWDNNGHAQMAVYRPGTGTFIVRHDDGSVTTAALGQAGDIPVVGDWDGVGHTQMGIFRPGANAGDENTFVLRHDDGSLSTVTYGVKGDLPVVGDWSNKGRTTYGVYRPGNGTFALSNAYAGTTDTVFTYGNGGTWS
ncbi:hypothetical protein [Streptomyces sp. NPDC090445]|uniref:hypothetical protein n=1 Tax=Streptomyces sp. NPDC090445 TaxID=3365963 RepID=UPI003807679F